MSGSLEKPMTVGEMDDVVLTGGQGFRAMGKFLRTFFERTNGAGALPDDR